MIVPVILSGGSGTRLWPLSTAERPKQFLPLIGSESLFSQALKRVADRQRYTAPVVVANAAHERLCLEELMGAAGARLILEPCARNTAAAIVMAAAIAQAEHGPDALILVMPSDQMIGDIGSFHEAVATGVSAAKVGRLVTFGVCPTEPHTGYGYLEAGGAVDGAPGSLEVARFTEKPSREVAEAMVAGGIHYWNAGIFLFRAGDFLAEAARLAPDISRCSLRAVEAAASNGMWIRPSKAELEACPSRSVDYAIMERSSRVGMVPLAAAWSDLGMPQPEGPISAVTFLSCTGIVMLFSARKSP